jgi:hypothetical protein
MEFFDHLTEFRQNPKRDRRRPISIQWKNRTEALARNDQCKSVARWQSLR